MPYHFQNSSKLELRILMKKFLIKKIEFTLFEVCIPDIGADPSGFGIWYDPPALELQRNGLP